MRHSVLGCMAMTKYKGIPLEMWKSERMLQRLSEDELMELYALMLCEFWDSIEPIVDHSGFVEANALIEKVKK